MFEPTDVGERLVVSPSQRNIKSGNYWAHMDRYLYAANEAAVLPSPRRVLDAASGSGYGTFILSRTGANCTGVDLSEEAVQYSNDAYGGKSVQFHQGNVSELEFPDESFDLVVSYETIEHLNRDDQDRFLKAVQRVLRKGGKFIVSAPVVQGGVENPEYNHCHQYEPDPDEFVEMIQNYLTPCAIHGQFIKRRATVAPHEAPTPGSNQAAEVKSGRIPLRRIATAPIRALRKVARLIVNALFERYYLKHPRILKLTLSCLYSEFHLRPINLSRETASHLIVTAIKD